MLLPGREVGERICPWPTVARLPAGGSIGRKPWLWRGGRSSGFTLLELMVVVVVIGIVSAMILPEMKGTFEDVLLRSTGRSLLSALSLASSQAITLNRLHRVRLDPESGRYSLERAGGRSSEVRNGFFPVEDLPGAQGQLDKRIRVQVRLAQEVPGNETSFPRAATATEDRRGSALTFYPDGTADPAEIVLRDREGFGLALRINPTTARVSVLELQRE